MYHVCPTVSGLRTASSTCCNLRTGVHSKPVLGPAGVTTGAPESSPCSAIYASMSLSVLASATEEGGAVKSSESWTACGSCEAARFGEEVEASDSIDSERCLLRLFAGSCAVNEGELDGDGGVSIALVGCGRAAEVKTGEPLQPQHIRRVFSKSAHRRLSSGPLGQTSPSRVEYLNGHSIGCCGRCEGYKASIVRKDSSLLNKSSHYPGKRIVHVCQRRFFPRDL